MKSEQDFDNLKNEENEKSKLELFTKDKLEIKFNCFTFIYDIIVSGADDGFI